MAARPTTAAVDRGRRWRLFVLKAIIFVAVLWFVGDTLQSAVQELKRTDWRLDPASLVLAGAIYLLGLVPAGLYWHWLLARFGQRLGGVDVLRAYFVGHLGKYVPGKAMVVVLRAGMAKTAGADARLATVAVVVETLTMMACGSAIAFVLIALTLPPDWKLALAAGLAVATGGPTLPPLLNRLLRRMRQRTALKKGTGSRISEGNEAIGATQERACPLFETRTVEEAVLEGAELAEEPPATRDEAIMDWRLTATGWAAMLIVWALLGLSLAVLLGGLAADSWPGLQQWNLATAAVALATVAGFLSLLPGGLIVRELILLDLLAPQVGETTALVAAVLLRLVWLVAELAAAGGLYIVSRSSRSTPP